MTVTLPSNLTCTGGSTGNICTVRCRNNAVAGPFGGCFAVQQTDVTPTVNDASTIKTIQSLDAINKQIAQNQADLPAAVAANQVAGSTEAEKGLKAVNALLQITVTTSASPIKTPEAALGGVAAAASISSTTKSKASKTKTTANATASTKKHNGNTNSNGNKNNRRTLRFGKRMVVSDNLDAAEA